jgi:hypothetical protein
MDDEFAAPPVRLLHQLATGDVAADDLVLLEAMLRAGGLAECPPWVQQRASRLAQARPQDVPRPADALTPRARLARLVFDSWSTPQPALLRGQSTLPRQLLLRAAELDVSLHVQAAAGWLSIIGQALEGAGGARGEALLVTAPPPRAEDEPDGAAASAAPAYGPVPLDAYGEFAFPHVALGRYILSLQLGGQRVDSVALALGAEPGVVPADTEG